MSNDLISRSELMEGRVENDPVKIAAMCASMSVLEKILEEIEKVASEHPYKVPGNPKTYGSYNEAWEDCADRIMGIITGMMEDEKDSDNDGWIPVYQEMDDKDLPNDGEIVLVSFENIDFPGTARYEKDEDGGAFFMEETDSTYAEYGMFVNAWQPLPKSYKPKKGDK